MTLLIIGIAAFLGLHVVPTFPDLRERLVARLGEGPYKGLFALLSVASFILLVYGFAKAPLIQLWSPPSWTRWVAIVLMLPAFIFLVAGYVPGQIKAKLKHPFWLPSRPGRSHTSLPMAIWPRSFCSARSWPMPCTTASPSSAARRPDS